MNVETDDMRLQFLKDFGFTDATFSDTTHGTTAKITALFRNENRQWKTKVRLVLKAVRLLRWLGHLMSQTSLRETRF